jgi:hydrogenase/urease accessory protein HupE
MAPVVYLLCGITSFICAVLLLRSYWSTGTRLIFWPALCFIGLAINNSILFVDLVIFPELDLSIVRLVFALGGMGILLFGLIWDTV